MPILSVIVPVYNAEKYLERCIGSILSQSFTDLELILVNDGSTDNSLTICERYSQLDSRVSVVNKLNGGASSARNFGIEAAKGDFICFVDADDYVNNQYLEALYHDVQMYDVDLVMHGMVQLRDDCQTVFSLERDKTYHLADKDEFFKDINLFRFCGPCCKLLNRGLLKEFGIRFNQQIIYSEDFDFLANYLIHCTAIRTSTIQNYYYVSHENSVSNRIYSFDEEYLGLQELYATLLKLCSQFNNDSLKFQVNKFLAYYVTRVLASVYKKPMLARSVRLSYLKGIDRKYINLYNQYDQPSTLFLKFTKYLYIRHCYRIYDFVYSIACKR